MFRVIVLRTIRAPALIAALLIAAPTANADPLSPIWTGLYLGAHGGASWADIDVSNVGAFDTSRATFGGHVGYNLGLGGFVVGIEADASHTGMSTRIDITGGGSANVESDWTGSVRGRLGVPIGPALLYATAGWAWTNATLTEVTAIGTKTSSSTTLDGVVYGIGAEAYVLPSISVRLEALRTDYRTDHLSLGGGTTALRDLDHGDTTVRAGVTLHLR